MTADAPESPGSILGPECSAVGTWTVGPAHAARVVAYCIFRNVTIAADGADEATARAGLLAKVRAHADVLRTAPEIAAVEEVNLVASLGPDGRSTRRFVRPMSAERAAIEFELGVDGAFVFLDEATGNFGIACRGPGGAIQTFRIGQPVHGDDDPSRPLPIPGRTPTSADEAAMRREKASRVRPLLRCPETLAELDDVQGGLRSRGNGRVYPRFDGLPVLALDPGYDADPGGHAVSQNTYGQQVLSLIERYRDGLVLDCGSGSPSRGFYNVVHLDLSAYPEVDVVTDGARLPFADATFDAVLSEAVLEHVRDPQEYCREVARVLKPGGVVRLDAAFLQPFHGYPDHYFNMTRSGLHQVVERAGLVIEALDAGPHQHPFVALSLLLNGYVNGTPDAPKRRRLLGTTIGDAIQRLVRGNGDPFDGLTKDAIDKLAAGFACVARKPG